VKNAPVIANVEEIDDSYRDGFENEFEEVEDSLGKAQEAKKSA